MEIKKAPMYHRREQSTKKTYGGREQLLYKLGVTNLDARVWLCAAANPALVWGGTGGSWGLASCPVLAGRAMAGRAIDSGFTEDLLSQKSKVESGRTGHLMSSSSLHKCTCKHTNTQINDIPTTNIYALSIGAN